jgi:hypothetical protein
MSLERYTCEWCGEHIDPGARVVQGFPEVEVHGAIMVDSVGPIYHEHDWDPAFGRESYRGPLRDIRPNAT